MIKETISSKRFKLKGFSGFCLKLFGWQLTGNLPVEASRCVMIMAPHTSNWDFVIGRLSMSVYGMKTIIFMKKELFFFPLGFLLKKLSCMPIDRKKVGNLIDYIASKYVGQKEFTVFITPEGTRGEVSSWKTGFHRIAVNADVPIVCSFMDFEKKLGGFLGVYYPTGDYNKDLKEIQALYKKHMVIGKNKENGFLG
jgi:1-acyl-sn-glycerol-3-phosphate acyltransferase